MLQTQKNLKKNTGAPNPRHTPKVSSGFTIVELLIVIIVIAILAAITIVAYRGVQDRAATVSLQSDLKQASSQLGIDRTFANKYPSSMGEAGRGEGLKTSPNNRF